MRHISAIVVTLGLLFSGASSNAWAQSADQGSQRNECDRRNGDGQNDWVKCNAGLLLFGGLAAGVGALAIIESQGNQNSKPASP
jgi:hypothetical protein